MDIPCKRLHEKFGDFSPNFDVAFGEPIELKTNIYPIISQLKEEYTYSFEIEPKTEDTKSILDSLLFKEDGENSKKMLILYDKSKIFSTVSDLECQRKIPIEGDPSKIVTIKIDKIDKINETEILFSLIEEILPDIYKSAGYTFLQSGWYDLSSSIKHVNSNIISGFKSTVVSFNGSPAVSVSNIKLVTQGIASEFLQSGVSNVNQREDLFVAINQMTLVTSLTDPYSIIVPSRIVWDPQAENLQSKISPNSEISLFDCYQQAFHFTIQPNEPFIETSQNKIQKFYPTSSITIVGPTVADKKLTERLSEININVFDIDKLNKIDSKFGIKFNENIIVNGNVIEPPQLQMRSRQPGNKACVISLNNKYSIYQYTVSVPPYLRTNPLFIFYNSINNETRKSILQTFDNTSNKIGIPIPTPNFIVINESNEKNSFEENITKYIIEKGTPSFIIVIYKNQIINRSYFRYLLNVEFGIPFLFSTEEEILTNITKVLFKVTLITGGIPFYISPNSLPLKSTMVIGINSSSKQLNALTSSYDFTFSRYFSTVIKNEEENSFISSETLNNFIQKAISCYNEHSEHKLTRIVIYREGLNIEQMDFIKKEFDTIIETINNKNVSVVYCIVESNSDLKLFGAKNGTIVLDKVQNENLEKFFLAINDSEDPIKFTLAQSTGNVWKKEHFAKLTYYLTYCYNNDETRCNAPAPLFCASKLIEFCKKELNGEKPNEQLNIYEHYL